MKRITLALSTLAVLALAACANGGTWTPMSDGRTAGKSQVETTHHAASMKADKSFSKSLHK